MKTSFVATVFNEQDSVDLLIQSIISQTKKVDEVIIVDGGSTDATVSIISRYSEIKLFTKKGNRSIGRNYGILKAKGDIILISDAGCILDPYWVRNITKPFVDRTVDVVAGYYEGKTSTVFQKCMIPYVLVMPDRVDPLNFLPATRSMAMKKLVWKVLAGFREDLSHNEDYVFARKLKMHGVKIIFAKDAIVSWIPRKNLREAFFMFFRFAKGDIESRIIRKGVVLLFLRYIFGLILIMYFIYFELLFYLYFLGILILFYILWSILKNYKYTNSFSAFFWLPVMQITADVAIILGSVAGI